MSLLSRLVAKMVLGKPLSEFLDNTALTWTCVLKQLVPRLHAALSRPVVVLQLSTRFVQAHGQTVLKFVLSKQTFLATST
ncbi:hypothetical protein R75483_00598 [Paraburkholderia domus]|nr:hypothetical protein R75483_00598 [Paraburkholderia domus]